MSRLFVPVSQFGYAALLAFRMNSNLSMAATTSVLSEPLGLVRTT
jgi:uncharacterized protein (DUF2062 family)